RMIAQYIGVAHGTIDREIKRGMVTKMSKQSNNGKVYCYYKEYYDPYTAQERYEKSRSNCGRTPIYQSSPEIINLLDDLMLGEFDFKDHDKFESLDSQKCSPYAALKIAESLVNDDVKLPASERSIYNWIDKGLLRTKIIDLLEKLGVLRPNMVELQSVNSQVRTFPTTKRGGNSHHFRSLGNGILVQGKKSAEDPVILVLAERLTRYNLAFKITSKTPNAVSRVITKLKELTGDYFDEIFKTITPDNGSEFFEVANEVDQVYYADAYSPWQRGTNENNNRLLRRSITKGTSLQLFSEFDVEQANLRLNSYPRKILGGKSSLDRFEEEILKIVDPETLAV
ncbi:IS30 family transposase, partial [Limosilactobacillus fermentum]